MDPSFDPGTSVGDLSFCTALMLQASGKVVVGGDFSTYRGVVRHDLMRLNSDASLDASFDPGSGFHAEYISTLVPTAGGKLVVVGRTSAAADSSLRGVLRVNADGSPDPTFRTPPEVLWEAVCAAVQPDGKLLVVGGQFVDGIEEIRMFRLNTDGSLDATFDQGTGFDAPPTGIVVQPDGRIVVCGGFTSYDGTSAGHILRLQSNGDVDPLFHMGAGANDLINTITSTGDGRLLIGGYFSSFDGSPRSSVARLSSNGDLDPTFDPGDLDLWVSTIAPLPDGGMFVGGSFDVLGPRLVRKLNASGAADASFTTASFLGVSGSYQPMLLASAVQPDGNLLIAGRFRTVGGVVRRQIARLIGCTGSTWYADADGDGFGDAGTMVTACTRPDGYVADDTDCNDQDATVAPSWPCDDGDPATVDDAYGPDCTCAGRYTQLTDTPDPMVSCGDPNVLINSSTIYALGVPNANRYQFFFSNTPGQPAYTRSIDFTTRSFLLVPWATSPMKAGRTYYAKVRSSFDNGATWSPWGATCTIHIGYPPQGRDERALLVDGEEPEALHIWPNPNSGDRFELALDGAEDVPSVDVQLIDPSGRVVMARQLASSSLLSVDLPQGLAAGPYIVQVTAGVERRVQRLMIE